jgi:DNA-binding IclR family transcriptional regulator
MVALTGIALRPTISQYAHDVHNVNSATPYPGTQAVRRAVELLKAFPPDRPERGLAELAVAVGLNRTTAYRLLTALQSEGMIEREGGLYRLGPEIMALGARVGGTGHLRAAARVEISALAEETGETVTIEVLVGREVLILDEAIGRHLVGTVPSLGTRWPAHATSTGKAILAHAPEEAVTEFLAEPLARLTPRTIVDPAAFRRELNRVKERAHAVTWEEVELGFVAVSVPVQSATGVAAAALSVGGPKARFGSERIAELAARLPHAAERISERLGHRRVAPRGRR